MTRKEIGMLYSTPMVRALLDGRKGQTRRTTGLEYVNAEPESFSFRGMVSNPELSGIDKMGDLVPVKTNGYFAEFTGGQWLAKCPYGKPGDLLYVREKWALHHEDFRPAGFATDDVSVVAQTSELKADGTPLWKPGIHLPKNYSRIWLLVEEVRVERLQDITEADAWAEGCLPGKPTDNGGYFPALEEHEKGKGQYGWEDAREWYNWLWEDINGSGSWDANPWVWVVRFRVLSTTGRTAAYKALGEGAAA